MIEYTVVGIVDETGDAQVAGVIEGRHTVTQEAYYDRWWVFVEADSPGEAGDLAVSRIEPQLEKKEDEG